MTNAPVNPPNPPQRASARRRLQADRNGVLVAAGIMAGVGWVLLYRLIEASKPLALQRWLFFILFYIAITGTALPFIWYLNQRFSRTRPATGGILLREGMWCGLSAVLAAWLQMIRALNGATVFFLALGVIAVESFLRFRERGQVPVESSSRSSRSRSIHD